MADVRENVIEWITGDDTVTVTLTQPRYITKVRKIVAHYAERNDDRVTLVENRDGSVFARFPIECLNLALKRTVNMSEEQKEVLRAQLVEARARKEAKSNV